MDFLGLGHIMVPAHGHGGVLGKLASIFVAFILPSELGGCRFWHPGFSLPHIS